jgi:hypothetical protein
MSTKLYINLPVARSNELKTEKPFVGPDFQIVYFDIKVQEAEANLINAYDMIYDYQVKERIRKGSELKDINELISATDWEFFSKICLIKAIDMFLMSLGFKGKLVEIVGICIDIRYVYPLAELNEYALLLLK